MGRKNFLTRSYYDKYQKFQCPLQMGFWHYSPNGCCLFINDKTQTIHHLYLKESCSLTRDGQTVQQLLTPYRRRGAQHNNRIFDDDDDDDAYPQEDNDDTSGGDCGFLNVVLQPYLNNITMMGPVDQRILNNMNCNSRQRLLDYNDEIMLQYWFIVCDLTIEYDNSLRNVSDNLIQHLVLKNMMGPLAFCSSLDTLSSFVASVTKRFIYEQMPVINNMSADKLVVKLLENAKFISKMPAQQMVQYHVTNSLFYMDARDLFDIVRLGQSGNLTNMRYVHLTNEANFLDTWRRILFNFVHELATIHTFEKQAIRIKSSCDALHFVKGNNRTVVPEFRCDADREDNCIHLKTRRKEFQMSQSRAISSIDTMRAGADRENYTISLSDDGVICRFVLKVMIDEYGVPAVDEKLNFSCYFNNIIYEHKDTTMWERVVCESLGIDRQLIVRDGSPSQSRERISCMQALCNEKRMNDIHRFCLPKRFLTLAWFKWACEELKFNIFE